MTNLTVRSYLAIGILLLTSCGARVEQEPSDNAGGMAGSTTVSQSGGAASTTWARSGGTSSLCSAVAPCNGTESCMPFSGMVCTCGNGKFNCTDTFTGGASQGGASGIPGYASGGVSSVCTVPARCSGTETCVPIPGYLCTCSAGWFSCDRSGL